MMEGLMDEGIQKDDIGGSRCLALEAGGDLEEAGEDHHHFTECKF